MSDESPIQAAVHQMRSQLSVLQAVIDDLSSGYELSTEDVADAKAAVEKLGALLKTLSDLKD